jgi:hypothetical protein
MALKVPKAGLTTMLKDGYKVLREIINKQINDQEPFQVFSLIHHSSLFLVA